MNPCVDNINLIYKSFIWTPEVTSLSDSIQIKSTLELATPPPFQMLGIGCASLQTIGLNSYYFRNSLLMSINVEFTSLSRNVLQTITIKPNEMA